MNHRNLQDIAKFAAGLVAADLMTLIWSAQSGIFPLQFLGMEITTDIIAPGIIFNLAALILLVHYGWHLGKIPRLRERTYLLLAGSIFLIVASAHLWRIFAGADLVIADWEVPLWLSWFGVAAATYLAYSSFIFVAKMGRK